MTVYFCLDSVFDVLLGRRANDRNVTLFVPVVTKIPDCGGHKDDALTLSSTPKILDLGDPKGCYQLAVLIEEVPLYRTNLELLVDDILNQRHHNRIVDDAIRKAFGGQPLPNTMSAISGKSLDFLDTGLRHPMIGHLDNVALCKVYLNFMLALPHGHDDFSFEKFILRNNTAEYQAHFDGYIFGDAGKVRADILLGFGIRADYDPRKPIDNYVENGRRQAAAMKITESHELIWAWLEADNYQMRRCHDIDRILTLSGLPRQPNWVRTDIFNCLEKEAIKQVLATKLIDDDASLQIARKCPAIQKALLLHAQDQIDDDLQDLFSQTLNSKGPYAGAADKFYLNALQRQKESRSL
jgi:hypothetical protein